MVNDILQTEAVVDTGRRRNDNHQKVYDEPAITTNDVHFHSTVSNLGELF